MNVAFFFQIVFFDRDPTATDDTMFWFWIHTSFVEVDTRTNEDFSYVIETCIIQNDYVCMSKEELDGAAGNKKNFDPEFKCEVFFFPNNADIRCEKL